MRSGLGRAWASLRRLDGSIVRGFSSILALRVVEKLAGFIVVTALFRMLNKQQVAEYGFLQTVLALCAIFGIQEFQNTINQSVSRGFPGTYRRAVPVALKWSVMGVVILAGFAAWYAMRGQDRLGQGFLIAAALFPSFHAMSQWKAVYLGEKDYTRFAVAQASNAILQALLIVAVLWIFPGWDGSMLSVIFIFLAVPSIQNLRQFQLCRKRISDQAPAEAGAIAYGLRANWYSAIGTAANNLDRLLIFTLLHPPMLAIYMAAEKFADLLQSIVQDLGAVLAPKFATVERYSRSLDDKLRLISLAVGLAVILFAIVALPDLLVLIFGKTYRESVIYAQLLVGAVAINNIASLRFRFIRSRLDAASYRNVLVIGSVSKIAASVPLIWIFGLKGAVASVILHRIVLATVVGHIIRSKYLQADSPNARAPHAGKL